MYFGADYYPEHWPQERWARDAELMQQAGFNVVRMAEFAWTRMEPEPGRFDFAWLDSAIELLAEHGMDTVLGTPTAAPPAWLMTSHPECFLVEADGSALTYGHRRNTCPTVPAYREATARIVNAMATHYANNPHVIGWQIDNEFGDRCYCHACQEAFQQWRRERYRSLETLNAAWGTDFWSHIYTAWPQIPLPWSQARTHNPGLALDYRRFMSDTYVDYQRLQIDILREANPDTFITHNLMGIRYPNLDYFDMTRDLDFVSWDNYPRFRGQPDLAARALAHDTMRGLKHAPFWVMEAQSGPAGQLICTATPRPAEIPYWAWQAIAHGADGIVFFRWRTCRFGAEEYWHGILDHHGIPGRRYQEVATMGRALSRFGNRIDSSKFRTKVALLLSYDSRFALQGQPVNPHLDYVGVFTSYYRALWRRNIAVDIVGPDDDLGAYDLVIAPTLYVLDDQTGDALTRFVDHGGTLVTTCRSGVMDEHNGVVNQPLPGLLADVCGATVEEYDSLDPDATVGVGGSGPLAGVVGTGSVWVDVLALDGAQALAHYTTDYYAGRAAVTLQRSGQGCAVYVGTVPDQGLADRLVAWLCTELDLQSGLDDVPAGVEVTVRETDSGTLTFLLNAAHGSRVVTLEGAAHELISGQDVSGELELAPRGVAILQR